MIYLKLVFDFIKFITKLLVIKFDNLKSPLKISFKKQNFKKSIIIGTGPSLLKDIYEINNYKKMNVTFLQ